VCQELRLRTRADASPRRQLGLTEVVTTQGNEKRDVLDMGP